MDGGRQRRWRTEDIQKAPPDVNRKWHVRGMVTVQVARVQDEKGRGKMMSPER